MYDSLGQVKLDYNHTSYPNTNVFELALKAQEKLGLCLMRLESGTFMLTWSNGTPPINADDLNSIFPNRSTPNPENLFMGGYVGWMCYEARHKKESISTHHPLADEPMVLFWPCDGAIHIDSLTQKIRILGSESFKKEAKEILAKPLRKKSEIEKKVTVPKSDPTAFIKAVEEIREDIKSGLVYQVNISWSHGVTLRSPLKVFESLYQHNPAKYASYLKYGDFGVVSNSPELFLKVTPEDNQTSILSTPIKGTANQTTQDALKFLWGSPKERAELSMVVDMVRNDLGRIAIPGQVHVQHRRIRRCGDLLHAEQQICAKVPKTKSIGDILDATFPPASVTGAPKISAMKTIGRLEKQARGIYTGCIGYIGYDGSAQFSVAIRCLPFKHQQARLHVGAGIVYDSSPQHEWLETLAKARAIHHIISPICE